jgi:hypothetical protein
VSYYTIQAIWGSKILESTVRDDVIEDQDVPDHTGLLPTERFIPQVNLWISSGPIPENPATRIAAGLLHNAANAYHFRPGQRPEIETWMHGGSAPWLFADACYVLRIFELESVRRFIRTQKPARGGRNHCRKDTEVNAAALDQAA